jgi:hypothetical protein
MASKLKTQADVKQPLTSDFYSTREHLIEDVPLTPEVQEELDVIARCYRKKNPENRKKLWLEYRQSQTVERDSSASDEPDVPESRAAEADALGPLARFIHLPLKPLKSDIQVEMDVDFADWLSKIPSSGIPELDPFEFLPDEKQSSFEVIRLALEPRLDSFMAETTWEQLLKAHGFLRFSCYIKHPTVDFMAFKSPRFYVFLVMNPQGIFLNYFVHPN